MLRCGSATFRIEAGCACTRRAPACAGHYWPTCEVRACYVRVANRRSIERCCSRASRRPANGVAARSRRCACRLKSCARSRGCSRPMFACLSLWQSPNYAQRRAEDAGSGGIICYLGKFNVDARRPSAVHPPPDPNARCIAQLPAERRD